MTKAELITATRNLANEVSTDSGALLDDTANLLDFINDAIEIVVLDLIPYMPGQFLGTETITLVANQANYSMTAKFLQIYKVERNESGKSPREIDIIDPLEKQFYMNIGDTEEFPKRCYFQGDVLYFVKTPSTAITDYANVYYIQTEATTLVDGGPAVIPAVAHRLIVYMAAALVAVMMEVDPSKFYALYSNRLAKVLRVWAGRYQSKTRFIREGIRERRMRDERDPTSYDTEWSD